MTLAGLTPSTAERDPTRPPATRYQGSKYRLLPWLRDCLAGHEFQTVLDAFSGTSSVAYLLRHMGKSVTANDYLRSNYLVARALIANPGVPLPEDLAEQLVTPKPDIYYDDLIERIYADIYYTRSENQWLDVVAQNLVAVSNPWQQAIAYYALFQACIVKRPYNLFHRRNLYMRFASVNRSFGNKVTWDRPFVDHFLDFVRDANRVVMTDATTGTALNMDALDVEGEFDLVYMDPPYVSGKGVGVNYHDFYHFLDGLASYATWEAQVDMSRKHRPIQRCRSAFSNKDTIHSAFSDLVAKHERSILAISYRSDGIPSQAELVDLMRTARANVEVYKAANYKYALSTNTKSDELLIVGW